MLEIANLKIIYTEISKLIKICWFEPSLAKTKIFSLTLTVWGI